MKSELASLVGTVKVCQRGLINLKEIIEDLSDVKHSAYSARRQGCQTVDLYP